MVSQDEMTQGTGLRAARRVRAMSACPLSGYSRTRALLIESGENGEPKLVYLVNLDSSVGLVERIGKPSRRIKETK